MLRTFRLRVKGLALKRRSTCPQGDFPTTEIGDSTREDIWFVFPFLGIVLALFPLIWSYPWNFVFLEWLDCLFLSSWSPWLAEFSWIFEFLGIFLSYWSRALPFICYQSSSAPRWYYKKHYNALVPLTPESSPFFVKNPLVFQFFGSSFFFLHLLSVSYF